MAASYGPAAAARNIAVVCVLVGWEVFFVCVGSVAVGLDPAELSSSGTSLVMPENGPNADVNLGFGLALPRAAQRWLGSKIGSRSDRPRSLREIMRVCGDFESRYRRSRRLCEHRNRQEKRVLRTETSSVVDGLRWTNERRNGKWSVGGQCRVVGWLVAFSQPGPLHS